MLTWFKRKKTDDKRTHRRGDAYTPNRDGGFFHGVFGDSSGGSSSSWGGWGCGGGDGGGSDGGGCGGGD